MRTCPELCKIKSGATSTFGLHQKAETQKNLKSNFQELRKRIGRKVEVYEGMALKRIKWPVNEVNVGMKVKLP